MPEPAAPHPAIWSPSVPWDRVPPCDPGCCGALYEIADAARRRGWLWRCDKPGCPYTAARHG